jgi:radical SAM superfamily enzyme YgiQ (UPF0313 family)
VTTEAPTAERAFVVVSSDGLGIVEPGAIEVAPTSVEDVLARAGRRPVRPPAPVTSPAAEPGPRRPGIAGLLRRALGRSRPDTTADSTPTPTPTPTANAGANAEAPSDPTAPMSPMSPVLPNVLALLDGVPHGWDPAAGALAALSDAELRAVATLVERFPDGTDLDAGLASRLRGLGLARPADAPVTAPDDRVPAYLTGTPEAPEPVPVAPAADLEPEPAGDEPGATADPRPSVHSVFHTGNDDPCLALGMITAFARTYRDGKLDQQYALQPPRPDARRLLSEVARDPRPRILLLSDYMWSITENLRVGAELKRLSPQSLTIHGGPSSPKYEADCAQFLHDHPEVDVVVRGEGEITLAELLEALDGHWDPRDLDRLESVAGLTFRRHRPDGTHDLVRTPDRERMTVLDDLPSPYLTGEFEELAAARQTLATIETNRGCPYGCTFCDWGSATNSRIRQFPAERVHDELRWVAEHGIQSVFFADANFGIFERDVEFARTVVELYRTYRSPSMVVASFAKNTIKHTAEIVRILNEGGVRTDAAPALQTIDDETLTVIRRKNLPAPKYDELVQQFRDLELPLLTDIMIGLPGSTVESFKRDLDFCSARNITIRFAETFILPNSPMNDPEYRREHAIRTSEDGRLIETSSYTTLDYLEMLSLRKLYRVFDHFGLLRHVMRHVAWDRDIPISAQLEAISAATTREPGRYPHLSYAADVFDLHAVEPVAWPLFYEEVGRFYERELGIATDGPMRTVLAAQEALMPSRHVEYPRRVDLGHDLVAYEDDRWHHPDAAKPLASYGPATFEVRDPRDLRATASRSFEMGLNAEGIPRREEHTGNPGFYDLVDWELESPLKRILYSQLDEAEAPA